MSRRHPPFSSSSHRASSPSRSETRATCVPSGDHVAFFSREPELRVRLTASPSLAGNRQDLAARLEQQPLAVRRQPEGTALGADADPLRPHRRPVRPERHRDLADLARRQIEHVEGLLVLEDDRAGADRGVLDVVVAVRGQRRHLARAQVETVQVEGPVLAVRREVDGVALPHRVVVGALPARDARKIAVGEPPHPDVLGLAALIPLPGGVLDRDPVVGDRPAVRRQLGEAGAIHGKPLLQPALDRHQVGRLRSDRELAPRPEQDPRPVRVPAQHPVTGRVVGQPPRHAAAGIHDVGVGAAVVAAGEGDQRAVRAELGVALRARVAGHPPRIPARARHDPEVVLVGEDDAVAVDIRPPHEVGLLGCASRRHDQQKTNCNRRRELHDSSLHRGRECNNPSPSRRTPAGLVPGCCIDGSFADR